MADGSFGYATTLFSTTTELLFLISLRAEFLYREASTLSTFISYIYYS